MWHAEQVRVDGTGSHVAHRRSEFLTVGSHVTPRRRFRQQMESHVAQLSTVIGSHVTRPSVAMPQD